MRATTLVAGLVLVLAALTFAPAAEATMDGCVRIKDAPVACVDPCTFQTRCCPYYAPCAEPVE